MRIGYKGKTQFEVEPIYEDGRYSVQAHQISVDYDSFVQTKRDWVEKIDKNLKENQKKRETFFAKNIPLAIVRFLRLILYVAESSETGQHNQQRKQSYYFFDLKSLECENLELLEQLCVIDNSQVFQIGKVFSCSPDSKIEDAEDLSLKNKEKNSIEFNEQKFR